jgi:hypothetical protein
MYSLPNWLASNLATKIAFLAVSVYRSNIGCSPPNAFLL